MNVEGYDFAMNGSIKTVLWVLSEESVSQSFPLESAGGTLRVVDRLGAQQLIKTEVQEMWMVCKMAMW